MDKKEILSKIASLDANQIVSFIKEGIIVRDDILIPACNPKKRKEVDKLLAMNEENDWEKAKNENTEEAYQSYLDVYESGSHQEDAKTLMEQCKRNRQNKDAEDKWAIVDKTNIEQLKEYQKRYPTLHGEEIGKMISEATKKLFIGTGKKRLLSNIQTTYNSDTLDKPTALYNDITSFIKNKDITQHDIYELLKEDPNLLPVDAVKMLCENSVISYDGLMNYSSIREEFISQLFKDTDSPPFPPSKALNNIAQGYTECYFWGTPQSGKTCTLGAVLSVANNGVMSSSIEKDTECQGYGYMTRLAAIFRSSKVCLLPERNITSATYDMRFKIADKKKKVHPISCIDMSGELFNCMYRSAAGEDLREIQQNSLQVLNNILVANKTGNRKIHFFVIEYGAEDKTFYDLTQDEYLNSGIEYLNSKKIFEKDTDAIYLIITKVDKTHKTGNDLIKCLKDYVKDHYNGLYKNLKAICEKNDINNKELEIIPFTLGDVCFQSFCLFNDERAKNIVQIMLDRSHTEDKGGFFEKLMKK